MLKIKSRLVLFAASCMYAASCGGGGGGSSAILGLDTPAQMSIVTPEDSGALPPENLPPADSDYALDQAAVWVYDPSIEPLKMVNMILCFLRQTGASLLVNQGPYKAQLNTGACEQGSDHNSSGSDTGQSSGSNATTFEIWTVDSTRATNSSPEIAHFWVPQDDKVPGMTIYVNLQVDSAVDALRPFGDFTLDFAAALDPAGVLSPAEAGTLATTDALSGSAGFELYHRDGDITQVPLPNTHSELTRAAVQLGSDGLSGNARIGMGERSDFGSGDSGIVTTEYLVAYDATELVRSLNGGATEAFHRDQFNEAVWRYNLYDATTGQRIDLDSGFGFRTATGDYGWMGYWGMWVQPGVSVLDGDTVTRDVFGQAGASYTVVKAPGKLIRYTKSHIDLVDLGGQTFQWWYFDPISSTSTNYLVVYNPLSGEWLKTGIYQPGSSTVDPIQPPQVIDVASLGFLNMWSDTLGGPTAYVNGDTSLTYYVQTFVNGSDSIFASGDLQLLGLVQCLRSGITASEAESGTINLPDAPDVSTPYTFKFQESDLTLYLDTTGSGGGLDQVGLADGEVPQSGPYTWGMRSGPLVTSTAGLTNTWDVWNASVFYVYETGANDWNQFTGLKDSLGAFVSFDAPISFRYVHSAANDRNDNPAYDGSTFFLQYGGAGNLWGLPQDGVDLNGDSQPDRWYPLVNLKDGTLLGPNGTEYILRAIEMEQSLKPDPTYAGTLDLTAASAMTLPTSAIFTAPEIGEEPVVTDPPRVIEGIVVGQSSP